jgi:hypothetical protein
MLEWSAFDLRTGARTDRMPREVDMFRDLQHAQSVVREKGFRMIDLKFSDLAGRWRHLTVPVSQFNEQLMRDGFGFDA